MSVRRRVVGEAGERLAEIVLARYGLEVVARNVVVGSGELDLLALHGDRRVAIEVRTITGAGEPLDAFDDSKARQVEDLARRIGADRTDLVSIRLTAAAAEVRWVPGVV